MHEFARLQAFAVLHDDAVTLEDLDDARTATRNRVSLNPVRKDWQARRADA